MSDALAVYVHVPFCPSKCGYCDFNSYAMTGDIMQRTTSAMVAQIKNSPHKGRPAKTIFFGGGTPTYIPTDQLLEIFQAVIEVHPPMESCEITSEANPGTADADKFKSMRRAGFNRLSIGAQSFVDSELISLERVHKATEIDRAVDLARNAGFENLNLDLMFALPRQKMPVWQANLDRAFALNPDHISLYCLTIEPNTTFYRKHLRGQLELPDDEAQVSMYDACLDRAVLEGFEQYEISNFAKPGRQCDHNLAYWRGEDYAGYGPGAVGCIGGIRGTNLKHPDRYCEAVSQGENLVFDEEPLDDDAKNLERVMLGLRLNSGISQTGLDLKAIKSLEDRGWLWSDQERVGLTRAGRHFCSEAVLALI